MALRAVIVEDEAGARQRLQALCDREGDIEVVGCADNARQAVELVRRGAPDLLFLDVQLRSSSAFEVLQALPEDQLPLVIFMTAYAEHAVAAFEHAAIDYLLKPFADERFRVTTRRARERAASLGMRAKEPPFDRRWRELCLRLEGRDAAPAYRRLLGERQQRFFFLDPKEIESALADHNNVKLVAHGETYLARLTMRELEERLEGTAFLRIHKSLMINLDHVSHMERGPRGAFLITMGSGMQCRSSPVYRARLLARASIRGTETG